MADKNGGSALNVGSPFVVSLPARRGCGARKHITQSPGRSLNQSGDADHVVFVDNITKRRVRDWSITILANITGFPFPVKRLNRQAPCG